MAETIGFKLNGRPVRLKVDGERTLLWVLRTDLGVTGPKYGCDASGGSGMRPYSGWLTYRVGGLALPSASVTLPDTRELNWGEKAEALELPAPAGVKEARTRPAARPVIAAILRNR